jgi:hypothetical protein
VSDIPVFLPGFKQIWTFILLLGNALIYADERTALSAFRDHANTPKIARTPHFSLFGCGGAFRFV